MVNSIQYSFSVNLNYFFVNLVEKNHAPLKLISFHQKGATTYSIFYRVSGRKNTTREANII